MAFRIQEIMNPETFFVQPSHTVAQALGGLTALQVTGAPVVDESGRPLGVISLRDLIGPKKGEKVGDRMTSPPVIILQDAKIQEAARLIGETGYRRLVVVNEAARVVGMVSAVDVIRGLIGIPAEHPASFPHLDQAGGLTWTDEKKLDMDHMDAAPQSPGIFTLIHGKAGLPETVIWVESSYNVRSRLISLLSIPEENDLLRPYLEHPEELRFRAASIANERLRDRLLEKMRANMRPGPSLAPKI